MRDFPTETQFLLGPALSPDGTRVIYHRVEGPSGKSSHLWMAAVRGGAPQRVTNAEVIELAGSWSPDGAWYVTAPSRVAGHLKGQPRVLPSLKPCFKQGWGDWLPVWSPDGAWILDPNRGVLLSADGNGTRRELGSRQWLVCAFAPADPLFYLGVRQERRPHPSSQSDIDGNVVRTIGALAPEYTPAANVRPGLRLSPTVDGMGLTYSIRKRRGKPVAHGGPHDRRTTVDCIHKREQRQWTNG